MPVVSVIIPTYNHRDFVVDALKSVFAQTFTDFEVIVINDGSPDDTASVLKPWIDNGRIRYIEQPNAGVAAARNRGLGEAHADFVAFLDDDDLWPSDKLQWQVAFLLQHRNVAIVAGIAQLVDASGEALRKTKCTAAITFDGLFEASRIASPGQTLMRIESVRSVGGFNPAIYGADDWDLYLRLARQHQIHMQDRIALFYRKHDTNASNDLRRMLYNCAIVIEQNLKYAPPSRRSVLRRSAYSFIYGYAGIGLVRRARADLRLGRFRFAQRKLEGLRPLFPVMIRQPRFLFRVMRDLLPVRVGVFSRIHRLFVQAPAHTIDAEPAVEHSTQ
jgi:glycosyltransferase involved in cell wall biosynthesis